MNMGPLLFISALAAYISYVDCQEACTTYTGDRGQCVSIFECDSLLELVTEDKSNQEILRKSKCGMLNGFPKVCCPSQCFTIEEQLGTCIGIDSCPYMDALLKPPISPDAVSYIRRSRCDGPDQFSVCCGQSMKLGTVNPNTTCVIGAAPPDPRSECCGVDSTSGGRILGGEPTGIDHYPWLAIIEYKKDDKLKLMCGGSLISGKYVLTAGHCVTGPVLLSGTPTNVRLGEYDTSNPGRDCVVVPGGVLDCNEETVIIPIERSIPHPQYDPNNPDRRNDIALLRLKRLAPYTDFIRPICLPASDLTQNPPLNFEMYAAGWGADETTYRSKLKLHVRLPFASQQSCQPAYSVPQRNVTLWKGQLCAGGEKGRDSCKGDSGGPLMYQKNLRIWEVTGVVSFGPTPCGLENIPGVYTNVFQYLPWLRSQIRP